MYSPICARKTEILIGYMGKTIVSHGSRGFVNNETKVPHGQMGFHNYGGLAH